MEKDFDKWNIHKKAIERSNRGILFKEGEVWWCSIGVNVGAESCGKGNFFTRPIIVIKKLSRVNFIGVPLSTRVKEGSWFARTTIQGVSQSALLYQVKMYSTQRLRSRLTILDAQEFLNIKRKLGRLLELST